MLLGEQIKA